MCVMNPLCLFVESIPLVLIPHGRGIAAIHMDTALHNLFTQPVALHHDVQLSVHRLLATCGVFVVAGERRWTVTIQSTNWH